MTRTPFNALYSLDQGTAGTNCTVDEHGTEYQRTSVITLTAVALPATITGSIGVGNLIYTFPAGIISIHSAGVSLAIQQGDGNISADTPDVGVGTVIASGAVTALNGTGTFEDILTGQTWTAACDGTVQTGGAALATDMAMTAAGAHTVYLNMADAWAGAETTGTVSGTVRINWERHSTA